MAQYVVVGADLQGQWVETENCWTWKSKSSATIPIALKLDGGFNELASSLIERGQLQCDASELTITYMINSAPSKGKVAPSYINNDSDLRIYLLDVDRYGSRPILKIVTPGTSHEGPSSYAIENDNGNYFNSDPIKFGQCSEAPVYSACSVCFAVEPPKKVRITRCSLCFQPGHKRTSCPTRQGQY